MINSIYCKNLCKCHNVQNKIKFKKDRGKRMRKYTEVMHVQINIKAKIPLNKE
jgi:hypothetical protein